MIDTAVILFTTIACLVVVFRAIKLDGKLPWYGVGASGAGPKFNARLLDAEDPDAS
jgi:hypothetical protein